MSRSASRLRSRPSWMSTISLMSLQAQPVEDDDLVDPVEELGPEGGLHSSVTRMSISISVISPVEDELAADVGGHDDDRVGEVDRPALAVGEPAVVEHLQQHVEDVGVGLLDLVEQDAPSRAGGGRPR